MYPVLLFSMYFRRHNFRTKTCPMSNMILGLSFGLFSPIKLVDDSTKKLYVNDKLDPRMQLTGS